jgi:hypothetical protein
VTEFYKPHNPNDLSSKDNSETRYKIEVFEQEETTDKLEKVILFDYDAKTKGCIGYNIGRGHDLEEKLTKEDI